MTTSLDSSIAARSSRVKVPGHDTQRTRRLRSIARLNTAFCRPPAKRHTILLCRWERAFDGLGAPGEEARQHEVGDHDGKTRQPDQVEARRGHGNGNLHDRE